MNGFVIARVSALVGVVVMAVTFFVYEPRVANNWLAGQEKRLAQAAATVEANEAVPMGWWGAAQTIRRWPDRRGQEDALTRWIGMLDEDVRRGNCAEGLVRARMGMQAQPGWNGGRIGRGSRRSEEESVLQFERAIELLEAWRADRPGEFDLFHMYTLALCYRSMDRGAEAEAGASGGVLDEWRAEFARSGGEYGTGWRVHHLSHMGMAFEDAGREWDAAGVYRELGRLIWASRHAGNAQRGGTIDRPAEVIDRLLMIGDVEGAKGIAARGHGAGGSRQSVWAWRDAATALEDGGQAGAAAMLRTSVLIRQLTVDRAEGDQAWWYGVAQLHAMLGHGEDAVGALGRALESAAEDGGAGWEIAASDRDLDGIRGLAGYAVLESRHGGHEAE